MKTLSYNDKVHEYKLVDDSGAETILPSVTQIASAVTGKNLSGIPKDVLEKARKRGNLIHADVDNRTFATPEGKWIKGQLPPLYVTERSDFGEIDGLVYAGTCDILADDELDDIKTIFAKEPLYWTIQLNLYRRMYDGMNKLNVFWTPDSGSYVRVPIQILNDAQMNDIISAYRNGRVLPKDWLAEEAPEAPTLDLVVYNQTPGELATNARVILATVKKQLEGYKAENYSETNIADAKKAKAELNNAAKTIDARRLELEKEFNKPFMEFKDVVKEIVSEIGKVSGAIDRVVKEVEQREKDEKKKIIETFFSSTKCELFPLDKIFNPTWLNKGTKIKDVEVEITAKIEKVNSDLGVLDRVGEPKARALYLDTLNLDSALAEADKIKANEARLAAIDKARVELAVPAVQAPMAPASSAPEADEPPIDVSFEVVRAPAEPVTGELLKRTFEVECTKEMLIALGSFMNANGIKFKKL
ncbi:MAG: DUF1351 domain-containing protein [Spirochaetes bacterium]|nr:DUF1351 domain-containing protein [Spirochaetota bacterium]